MAYATGSAATLNELLIALQTFATTQGWTIDKWTSGSNLLFLHKGQCHVAMQASTFSVTHYPAGVSTTYTDTTLRMALSTSINTALTTYHGHPGSVVTTATDLERVEVNDLRGPFNAYHFFSGDETAGDPAYIYVVLQTAVDRYQHFGFGNVDKKGMTHSGGAFLGGYCRYYYRWMLDLTSNSSNFNDPASHALPYDCTKGSLAINCATMQWYVPDALPMSWTGTVFSNFNVAAAATPVAIALAVKWTRPSLYPALDPPRLASNVIASPVSQWSGNVHLWPSPIMMGNGSQLCYVGDHPNVRFCNMESLGPAQEVTYGTETWVVFPSMTQRAWNLDRISAYDGCTSGHYAIAYKKVT